jgi:hypothetical protein
MSESRPHDGRAKRGRKHVVPDPGDGPVARFSCELLELKRSAGDPSYDRMRTEFGAASSKSTLSAATRGQQLPSWETTWEFVRSLAVIKLGNDVESVKREWRAKWEQASAPAREAAPNTIHPIAEVFATDAGRAKPLSGVVAAIAVAAVIGVILAISAMTGQVGQPASDKKPANTPAYPVPGDDSTFGGDGLPGDVTFPDGSAVRVGETFRKTWRLKNAGTVRWQNRQLRQFGGTTDLCESPAGVPIPTVEPGALVEVTVPVTPKAAGVCKVVWKIVDENGNLVLPNRKGVFYEVNVTP